MHEERETTPAKRFSGSEEERREKGDRDKEKEERRKGKGGRKEKRDRARSRGGRNGERSS